MIKKLVIVESPAKAKTIQKYLGKGYEVVASMGHVRDLPKSTLGIDLENNFNPKYINIRKQSETIKALKAAAKRNDKIFLATDPDREGEAISWHLAQLLGVDLDADNRVTFGEITKSGVKAGMSAPRKIDMNLVDAQQARRIMDRIVGYKISPFLWKKVRNGLSAGRVQSAAVKMLVDREREIRAFVPQEYWTVEAKLYSGSGKKTFTAKYYGENGKKKDLSCEADAQYVLDTVKDSPFTVTTVKLGTREKSPAPPFITSTLQQEASRRLGFQAKRTMKAAQELYEGVDVKGYGTTGLITYMRTDSLRLSEESKAQAREYIEANYGTQYMPDAPRAYKTKNNAQDAHEAIRPTVPAITPDQVKDSVTGDQYKLYKLIWERFIACQMANAIYDTVSASFDANGMTFRASGYSVKFAGFTALYEEKTDEKEESNSNLPPLHKGDALKAALVTDQQHFTQPPPRYTEATLIKTMEENGIGRPSTYAPTITTIATRNYVEREGKQLVPTNLGEITNDLMEEYFSQIVDVSFTANLEQQLDVIADGKTQWRTVIGNFYDGFKGSLENAEQHIGSDKIVVPDEVTDVICEFCGRNMVIKYGRFGKFLACPGYPECKNAKRLAKEAEGSCPLCGGKLQECKSKKGRKYYGCVNNPTCSFMTWDTPTRDNCPKCGKTLLHKAGKNGKFYCSNEACDYERKE